MRTTDLQLAEMARLDSEATPGPWIDTRYHEDSDGPHIEAADEGLIARCTVFVPEHSGNGAFIAAARTLLPDAAADLADLRAAVRDLLATADRDDVKGGILALEALAALVDP